ncbi:unnamed protein product [Nesidiocoris tenuis]|uniref:Uncharacterized protein n=1 Tax=Nesidiocoris tenuis TaxID=355587 RepID=A0A6H5GRM7_9HEMI|nr:unnamed protein product [Nesidiocoris tenuis]
MRLSSCFIILARNSCQPTFFTLIFKLVINPGEPLTSEELQPVLIVRQREDVGRRSRPIDQRRRERMQTLGRPSRLLAGRLRPDSSPWIRQETARNQSRILRQNRRRQSVY